MIGALLLRFSLPRLFQAISSKDLEAVCQRISDDAIFEFPGQSSISGTYKGGEAIRGFWRTLFERYESFTMTPRRIGLAHPYALGLTNTALLEWRVDAVTRDGLTVHAEGVAVIEIRRGKKVHGRDYFFDPTVLEPVWGRRTEVTQGSTTRVGQPASR